MADGLDDFLAFAFEIADGHRWELLRKGGWEDFEERLATSVGELPVRRRQALMMLLFALLEGFVEPDDIQAWLDDNDVEADEGVEDLIAWLRLRREEAAG